MASIEGSECSECPYYSWTPSRGSNCNKLVMCISYQKNPQIPNWCPFKKNTFTIEINENIKTYVIAKRKTWYFSSI